MFILVVYNVWVKQKSLAGGRNKRTCNILSGNLMAIQASAFRKSSEKITLIPGEPFRAGIHVALKLSVNVFHHRLFRFKNWFCKSRGAPGQKKWRKPGK